MGAVQTKEQLKASSISKLVENLKADSRFMEGIKRGVADCKAGRMRDLEDVKRELGSK
jgi:predicted transcriptional regulator